MKTKSNNKNRLNSKYNKAVEYALKAIYDDCIVKVEGQTFTYDKQHNLLYLEDFTGKTIYRPKFNGMFCDVFAERVEDKSNEWSFNWEQLL